ncbi:MAG: acetyltransferase [Acidobacteria bacterium]|nr:acetyltransferase [Acidobacteriota bacterium]
MIVVRELVEHAELVTAVMLQKEIWGFADIDLLPLRLFVVATKIGGQVLGAFDGDHMVGFLISIPGIKPDGRAFLHSQMMGVVAEYRNAGAGRMMELKQRELALALGVNLIEWTFDPLELKNAFFNIERLGAVVKRYVLNQYGTTSSQLHAGLPTDRCIAEWHLDQTKTPVDIVARIEVPNVGARTIDVQSRISQAFLEHFRAGRTVVGFERGETHGVYLLADQDGLV